MSNLIEASAAELFGEDPNDLAFLHVLLAQCALPYRQPPEYARDYHRENGRASIIITAGHLADPATGEAVLQRLPSGAKPRLLLLHVCTEAVRRQSPMVPIKGSMSALMRELGLQVTGGRHGTIGAFKEQLNRLAAAHIRILWNDDRRAIMLNAEPIERLEVWFPRDPRQQMLWPSEVTLSTAFYESLREHALPLHAAAIRELQHTARGLDAYSWLAFRLPRVRASTGDFVSWAALQRQFGDQSGNAKVFRRMMLRALQQVLKVYPTARLEPAEGGLRLRRSPPPVRPRIAIFRS